MALNNEFDTMMFITAVYFFGSLIPNAHQSNKLLLTETLPSSTWHISHETKPEER